MTTSASHDAPTSTSRKRSQPEADEEEDQELDGTSTPTATTPAKKRKLNGTPAKESPSAPTTFKAITSAISSAFGYGPKPQNGNTNGNGTAAAVANGVPKPSPARPAIKLKALKGTIWDNEEKPRLGAASPSAAQRTPKSARGRGRPPKGTPRSAKQADSVTGTPSAGAVNGSARQNTAEDSPSKPRSAIGIKVSDGLTAQDLDDDSADELSGEPVGTPTKTAGAKRLWGSKSATVAASPAPKSILTPSKKRNQTPKSVKFNKETSTEVFFDDIPKSAGPKKPSKAPVNEILCGLCAKGHSRAPNQIILCDNCDFAVHQECYGVQEIPEGDWLCKSCSQEDVLKIQPSRQQEEIPTAAAPVAVMTSEAPDIPNLEIHLRAHQRVLLDRCTGQRRIEIFGLQDVRDKAYQLMEQTVAAGEGNSMLLIGARGSGKTNVRIYCFSIAGRS